MPFSARNARYLRISTHTVLPLYIYLDDKHVEWMTDYTLQCVLEDLRHVIGPKLRAENNQQSAGGSNAKKGTVDVHRGDTYQFAYFFRKNEPHAVLIKSRKFVPALPVSQSLETPVVESAQLSSPQRRKRGAKPRASPTTSAPGVRSKTKTRAKLSDSDDEAIEEHGDQDPPELTQEGSTRRSLRKRTLLAGGYYETEQNDNDIVMVDPLQVDGDTTGGSRDDSAMNAQNAEHDSDAFDPDLEPRFSPVFNNDTEGHEEKPKLSMRVTYQGFTIYDKCLCVIIEPWPTSRDKSRARSVAPSLAQNPSVSTELREQTPMMLLRERTPLFLPELDPRRSATPAPLPSRFLPPVPLFDENAEPREQEDFTDGGGMMAFSQALKSVAGERAGSADGDDNEGEVFLGDADERRGEP
ncbi:hypothetical protein JB92DRAFT_3087327 [Gautieria morchelliformis]|nr:hypothetical protein JB92DRAFT_3087327 [Gautieria morchelliformis]